MTRTIGLLAALALVAAPALAHDEDKDKDEAAKTKDRGESASMQQTMPPEHAMAHGQKKGLEQADVQQTISGWPEASKQAAQEMIDKYGTPQVVSDSMLRWEDNQPWAYTVVHSEPVQHDFPVPHQDVLEQAVHYEVPVERVGDLVRFDGSMHFQRTQGLLAVTCGNEESNVLAMNLAHRILEQDLDVEQARQEYFETARAMKRGEHPPITASLQFEPASFEDAHDPGETVEIAVAEAEAGNGRETQQQQQQQERPQQQDRPQWDEDRR